MRAERWRKARENLRRLLNRAIARLWQSSLLEIMLSAWYVSVVSVCCAGSLTFRLRFLSADASREIIEELWPWFLLISFWSDFINSSVWFRMIFVWFPRFEFVCRGFYLIWVCFIFCRLNMDGCGSSTILSGIFSSGEFSIYLITNLCAWHSKSSKPLRLVFGLWFD